jgi:hypothetical protein
VFVSNSFPYVLVDLIIDTDDLITETVLTVCGWLFGTAEVCELESGQLDIFQKHLEPELQTYVGTFQIIP